MRPAEDPIGAVDETRALEALRQILARPEFQPPPRPVWERWWEAFRAWLWDLLLDLLQGVPEGLRVRFGWVEVAVMLLTAAAVLLLVVFVTRSIGLAVTGESRRRTHSRGRSRERSDRLWRRGQELAAAGRFAEAVRAVYLSALYALEERGLLRVEEALTNREHAQRALRAHPALGETFARLVQLYDRLRYGQDDVERGGFAELSELVGQARATTAAPS